MPRAISPKNYPRAKLRKKNVQVMRCHNTGIQFLFKQLEGIQSDFDEFDQGIIEGVLYSKNK